LVQGKPDPRIEELVRQAEAIKPGSGEAIRQALTARNTKGAFLYKALTTPAGVSVLQVQEGKRIIIITVNEHGKIMQVQEGDMKKLFEKKTPEGGIHFRIHPDTAPAKPAKPAEKAKATKKAVELELVLPIAGVKPAVKPSLPTPMIEFKPAPATKKAPLAPATPDIAELSRQIDRLHRELDDLRSRLDAQKKTAK
jgi:hypothetical protein